MQKFYRQFIKSGDLCFDVGANVGHYSNVFLNLGGHVIAIEPIRENIISLYQRFKNEENLVVVGSAVSSELGVSEIHKGSFLELSTLDKSFVSFNEQQSNDKWKGTQSVNLTTLDELIKIHGLPQFCKIDVEGHETAVLTGLTSIIPVISFEFLFPFKEKALTCIEKINELAPNATYNYSLFEFFEMENKRWLNSKAFVEHFSNLPKSHWTGDIFCRLL